MTTSLPPILKVNDKRKAENDENNPFSIPKGINIFTTLREKQRQLAEERKKQMLALPIHLKSTVGHRGNLSAKTRKEIANIGTADDLDLTDEILERENKKMGGVDKKWILRETAGARRGGASAAFRSSRYDYIKTKRQMFFAQYGLSVKKTEMKNLENLAKQELSKIEQQEVALQEDAEAFDRFLKDNDEKAVSAIKEAEKETRLRIEKQQVINNLTMKKQSLKNQIMKCQEDLDEAMTYREFLFMLSPKEWCYEQLNMIMPERTESRMSRMPSTRPTTAGSIVESTLSMESLDVQKVKDKLKEIDNERNPDIYFHYPEEIINLLHDLEESNICLIRNSQNTEKEIEDLFLKRKSGTGKIDSEIDILKNHIDKIANVINKYEARVDDFKMKCKLSNMGTVNHEQETEERQLTDAVTKVYKNTLGDNAAQLETLQMLSSLEAKMENLFDQIEQLPADAVEAAERAQERQRRLRHREEITRQQKLAAEERVKRALARATEVYKKRVGKKLVYRSAPLASRQAKRDQANRIEREKENEEHAYFFT